MSKTTVFTCFTTLVIASIAVGSSTAEDWTNWRGPGRDGHSAETGLVSRWSPDGENLAWRAPYGGRSTPIVHGDHLYLQNAAGEGADLQERIMCFDADTGELLWERRINLYMSDVPPHRVGWASPAVDPATGNVFVYTVGGSLLSFTSDGELLWEWHMGNEQQMLHHDIEPLPNGNILAIAWELKTPEEARAAGRRVDLVPEQGIWSEWILEVEPIPPNDARIVWEWHVWDHLIQNHDPDAASYGDPREHPRRLDVNADAGEATIDPEELEQLKALGYVPDDATSDDIQSDFLHMNGIDYHSELDQIAVSVPEIGEVWILDHSTSTEEARGSSGGRYGHGGDFLYRWGNPRTYGRGDASDQKLFYQHEVMWIPEDWEHAGNLTVFNNGGERPDGNYSSVVEWTPPLEEDGSHTLTEGEPFGPEEAVWRYLAEDRESFFAPFVSGAHRLENGNTFICSGPQGRIFEVTRDGEIVWEYRNPYHGEVDAWTPGGTEGLYYALFRATKLPPDHAGLAGRELSPLEPQPPTFEPPPRPPGGGESTNGSGSR